MAAAASRNVVGRSNQNSRVRLIKTYKSRTCTHALNPTGSEIIPFKVRFFRKKKNSFKNQRVRHRLSYRLQTRTHYSSLCPYQLLCVTFSILKWFGCNGTSQVMCSQPSWGFVVPPGPTKMPGETGRNHLERPNQNCLVRLIKTYKCRAATPDLTPTGSAQLLFECKVTFWTNSVKQKLFAPTPFIITASNLHKLQLYPCWTLLVKDFVITWTVWI